MNNAEVALKADFSVLRYAQCWEDADVLLEGLAIQPGNRCLSIASAGDNALAMLAKSPSLVVAVDLSAAQIAAVQLRVAAFRELEHSEMLELLGLRRSARRAQLYERIAPGLPDEARSYFSARPADIERGAANCGKFERYFSLFRARVLPMIHSRRTVLTLLAKRTPAERAAFYRERWDTWQWRGLFRVFFSRFVMGRLGRDPSFFDYVDGSVSDRILARAEHALVVLDPSTNPYLQRILCGEDAQALPFAMRAENFESIRANIDRLQLFTGSLEDCLDAFAETRFDRCNLSDIFEYMSSENYAMLLARIARACVPGGRLLYWNMLAQRSCPPALQNLLKSHDELAAALHQRDKAFFYSRLVVEEVT